MSSQTTRILLPAMISISNNSMLTGTLANTLSEKLSEKELNDFLQWIKIIESAKLQQESGRRQYFR